MRNRAVGAVALGVLVLMAIAVWWAWPRAASEGPRHVEARAKPLAERVAERRAERGGAELRTRPTLSHLPDGHPDIVEPDEAPADTAAQEGLPIRVAGVVRDTLGRAQAGATVGIRCVTSDGDRRWGALPDDDGRFSLFAPPGTEHCELQAMRYDGLLPNRSDRVDLVAGDDVDVTLVIDAERRGGLGIQIAEVDGGIQVQRVFPGTPAWEAGLRTGDVIVEVDGLSTHALTLDEFQQVMTGPEGSDVDFTLAGTDDDTAAEVAMRVTRRFLDRSIFRS